MKIGPSIELAVKCSIILPPLNEISPTMGNIIHRTGNYKLDQGLTSLETRAHQREGEN